MARMVLIAGLLIFLQGCATLAGSPDKTGEPAHWREWCGQGPDLRQRFELAAGMGDNQMAAIAFLALESGQDSLDAVILTPLGFKIAILHVTPDGVNASRAPSPLPGRFLDQCGLALRRAMLLAWPCLINGPADEAATLQARAYGVRLDGGSGDVRIETPTWTAWTGRAVRSDKAEAPKSASRGRIPELVTIRDAQSGFTLKLAVPEENDER